MRPGTLYLVPNNVKTNTPVTPLTWLVKAFNGDAAGLSWTVRYGMYAAFVMQPFVEPALQYLVDDLTSQNRATLTKIGVGDHVAFVDISTGAAGTLELIADQTVGESLFAGISMSGIPVNVYRLLPGSDAVFMPAPIPQYTLGISNVAVRQGAHVPGFTASTSLSFPPGKTGATIVYNGTNGTFSVTYR